MFAKYQRSSNVKIISDQTMTTDKTYEKVSFRDNTINKVKKFWKREGVVKKQFSTTYLTFYVRVH